MKRRWFNLLAAIALMLLLLLFVLASRASACPTGCPTPTQPPPTEETVVVTQPPEKTEVVTQPPVITEVVKTPVVTEVVTQPPEAPPSDHEDKDRGHPNQTPQFLPRTGKGDYEHQLRVLVGLAAVLVGMWGGAYIGILAIRRNR